MQNFKNRPLSPHLSIYKIQETSLYSILQRISGALIFLVFTYLYLGSLFFFNHFLYLNKYILLDFYIHFYFFMSSLYLFIFFSCFYHTIKGILSLFLDILK
uniref:succinate:cytochrome c oxidoreductase subunit 3 n=1 Tax=Pseudoerythrocladia kornmannii TaxID=753682 RepID=UPI001FCE103B|nr:succinate:cytochrome c oxidoreductase subunit 3 [Pseudoerythrocladia kornmannii]UNJ19033.1 succinate:cytochrome c oxidoreductase subunit 3 [Pseudoerythrocladia kornmannii]